MTPGRRAILVRGLLLAVIGASLPTKVWLDTQWRDEGSFTQGQTNLGEFAQLGIRQPNKATSITPSRSALPASFDLSQPGLSIGTPANSIANHSPSLAALADGGLVMAWFGGSREGARDVKIFFAKFDGQQWSEARAIMGTDQLIQETGRYITKLGNPMIYFDDALLHCWFVSVSLGGWGGARLNHMASKDGGVTWSIPKLLVTSPFLNVSTLVRSSAFPATPSAARAPSTFGPPQTLGPGKTSEAGKTLEAGRTPEAGRTSEAEKTSGAEVRTGLGASSGAAGGRAGTGPGSGTRAGAGTDLPASIKFVSRETFVPAYFELTHKYPVMLRVDAESRILDRYPFGGLTGLLQPTVVRIPSTLNLVSGASTVGSTKTIAPAEKVDSEELLAFFRRSQALPLAKVFMSRSHDNGQTWTPAQAIGIPNGDASVVAWADNDHIWLVANPEPYHRRSIASFQLPLPLGEASPILPTRILDEVTENAPGPKEFSYPSFATTTDGRLHLAYTADGRSRIRHRVWSSLVPNPPVTSKQP